MKNQSIIKTPGRFKLQYRGVDCLNCGHPLDLSDKYCPNCSQANSTKKLTLLDFFEEFFSNYFSYDSKLWQTLAALLLKPGKITREYISGKRLSYTNPFRFLLSRNGNRRLCFKVPMFLPSSAEFSFNCMLSLFESF